jgi:DNA-directed RNA polymerase specialized sigma24 family protein
VVPTPDPEANRQPSVRAGDAGQPANFEPTVGPSDAAIMVGIERGREEALAGAHHRHGPSVYQLARRMCDPDDADDVTHEVFLALWRAPERYDPERASLRSHLLTQTYREAGRRLSLGPSRGPGGSSGPVDRHPGRARLSGEEAWRLLARLPDDKRGAIVSAYFGEHTYQQVAARLSEQDGAVNTHLYACMTELRARLAVDAFLDKMHSEPKIMSSLENPTTTTELTSNLSEVARVLFAAGSVADTLQAVVDQAVASIEGCDFAGIFLLEADKVATAVKSDPVVLDIDGLQQATGEGPCLDAIQQRTTVYAEDLADDARWPTFGPQAAAAGARCALAFHLYTNGTMGALNLYAQYPRAFGATDRAKGLIFATLSALALGGARTHEDEDRRASNLNQALATRELIGQAQGILMERERITSDQAFDILRRASQHLNVRLREVAQDLVDTGDRPVTRPPTPGAS